MNPIAPVLLYLAPSDPKRTAISEYARNFRRALALVPGLEVVDFLPRDMRELVDSPDARMEIRERTRKLAIPYSRHRNVLVHVELGNALHREFWAGRYLQEELPQAQFHCTVHDPPKLCSNPYRFVRTNFHGVTPFQLTDKVITRSVEIVVDWLRRRIELAFIKQMSQIAALTHEGAALLRSMPKFAGPRIVEMKHVAGPEMTRAELAAVERNPGMFNVVLFGFLGPHKGIEDLVQAFEILAHRLKDEKSPLDPRLSIFGGIPQGFVSKDYYEGIRRRIEDSYFFQNMDFAPGHVTDEERDKRLALADVMVLPFHQSHGVIFSSASLIRAMAMGKAVVASHSGTMREELQEGERGLLFEQGNARELADALYRMAQDPDLRHRLGARAREHILQEHSPEALAQFLKRFYGLEA